MSWLLEPFTADFMLRALVGGVLVAAICAVVGTWVVLRGMAFLGEAMGHGMLPGVAVATLVGAPVLLGAALSATVMTIGVGLVRRRGRLSHDTSIGLLFVAMLALGVIVISHSGSFASDTTAILFGDVLAIRVPDLVVLALALLIVLVTAAAFHRSFVALAFDERVAKVMGLRPALAQGVLVGLVTVAVVASYQAVGSLLVVGLLLAPAVAAAPWTTSIESRMLLGALVGALAVGTGLVVSWHSGTAAGASIAATSIAFAAVSSLLRAVVRPTGAPVAQADPVPTEKAVRALP
ncbi:zinc ABC transporter permease AztB [Desertivibrio insolitus]|uniref:zinc ABC transporter permease AztB n=1 Tax=Herbiconiux sp. SYSU D00978 TaxID=2812562 RepID=UPI001A97CAD8|nr:zinc ABC transporter permease AztB [Herbiconiux sp. SYSU D00978]